MNRFFGSAKPKTPKPTLNDAIATVSTIKRIRRCGHETHASICVFV